MIPQALIEIPQLPVGEKVEEFVAWLTDVGEGFFEFVKEVISTSADGLTELLLIPDPVIMTIIFAVIALVAGWRMAIFAVLGMLFIISMEQWEPAMQTLSLVLVATIIAVVIAIPLGILAAKSDRASAAIKPVMDLMQTMPAMVWLIPVIFMFGIGVTPGVVATIVFALPPGVRFTELGIRGVDSEIVEAANAFGANPVQTLFGVQLPLAMPTIMAGINQVIMLALSMAVIAGMVGAEGLGGAVTQALATANIGLGAEAGLAVVVLAIYLDRVTASVGRGGLLSLLRRRGKGGEAEETDEPHDPLDIAAEEQAHTKVGA